MEVECSLDNVTWMGEWEDWGVVVEQVRAWHAEDEREAQLMERYGVFEDEDLAAAKAAGTERLKAVRGLGSIGSEIVGCPGANRHRQSWVVDGTHVSQVCELGSLGRSWVPAAIDGAAGRIEFNPNKVSERVLSLFEGFRVSSVSRVDVAIDYHGVGIGDYIWRRDGVKTCEWRGSDGVESMVFGASSSGRRIRVYDKGLELGRDDLTVTRCEGQGRRGAALGPRLFEGVSAFSGAMPDGLSAARAGSVALYLHYPAVFARLDRRVQREVRRVLNECGSVLEPGPSEVYAECRRRLVDSMEALQAGVVLERASVYA